MSLSGHQPARERPPHPQLPGGHGCALPPWPLCESPGCRLPFSVDVWQGLLGRVSKLPVELGEVQLFRLQVPGGTTRGRERGRAPLVTEMRRSRGPWGRRQAGKQLRKGWAGRGGTHPPRAGPGGDPSLGMEPGTSALCSRIVGQGPAYEAFVFFNPALR